MMHTADYQHMSSHLNRPIICGKFIALDGDKTTTGATCIATPTTLKFKNRSILSFGDLTTSCPKCKKKGIIITGQVMFGKLHAVDGSIVQCGCPYGTNIVITDDVKQKRKLVSGLFSMSLSQCRYYPPSSSD